MPLTSTLTARAGTIHSNPGEGPTLEKAAAGNGPGPADPVAFPTHTRLRKWERPHRRNAGSTHPNRPVQARYQNFRFMSIHG